MTDKVDTIIMHTINVDAIVKGLNYYLAII